MMIRRDFINKYSKRRRGKIKGYWISKRWKYKWKDKYKGKDKGKGKYKGKGKDSWD